MPGKMEPQFLCQVREVWLDFGTYSDPGNPSVRRRVKRTNKNAIHFYPFAGVFPLTEFEGEIVLSLRVDPHDHHLLAGDTCGVISIFDISQYATSPPQGQVRIQLLGTPLSGLPSKA